MQAASHIDVLVANLSFQAPTTAAVHVGEDQWAMVPNLRLENDQLTRRPTLRSLRRLTGPPPTPFSLENVEGIRR